MYIVAIAWMYVVVLMAATQDSVLAGMGTLVFYGVLPCSVVMYLIMAPSRAKQKKALLRAESAVENAVENAVESATINNAAPPANGPDSPPVAPSVTAAAEPASQTAPKPDSV